MNISIVSGINEQGNYRTGSIIAGKLPILQNTAPKSAQEKAGRQQKADSQVAFWEKQKESLKSRACDTVEDIAKKLETLHDYEDEIAAAKKAYNYEQMYHVLDEAEETGEKIAEAAEKMEPKTPEERQEELAEEALGTEEDKGVLEEMLKEPTETLDKAAEEMTDMLEEPKDVGSIYDIYRVSKGKEWERLYPGVDIKI